MARLAIEQNSLVLLLSIFLAAVATLLAIIGVSTDGWPGSKQLFKYHWSDTTAAGVLLLISIVLLALAALFTVMFWRGIISNAADRMKSLILVFLISAAILITVAYVHPFHAKQFSLHLSVAASVLAFLSAVMFSFWLGRTSMTYLH